MKIQIAKRVRRVCADERGVTTVEYTIVLCLIAGLAVGAWQKFGSNVYGYLDKATTNINTEMNKPPGQ